MFGEIFQRLVEIRRDISDQAFAPSELALGFLRMNCLQTHERLVAVGNDNLLAVERFSNQLRKMRFGLMNRGLHHLCQLS